MPHGTGTLALTNNNARLLREAGTLSRMKTKHNTPTRSTANAHNEQIAADTNSKAHYSGLGLDKYECNRKRELAYGYQVKVPLWMSQSAGVTCPLFLSRMIYADLVEIGSSDQDKDARLHRILMAVNVAISNASPESHWIPVPYSLSHSPRGGVMTVPVSFIAAIGPLDIDDPQPAITVMYPYPDYDPFPL